MPPAHTSETFRGKGAPAEPFKTGALSSDNAALTGDSAEAVIKAVEILPARHAKPARGLDLFLLWDGAPSHRPDKEGPPPPKALLI